MRNFTRWLDEIGIYDFNEVGGKNASLGEMYSNLSSEKIKIPNAFVLTADSYNTFIKFNNLEKNIKNLLASIDTSDIVDLREKA